MHQLAKDAFPRSNGLDLGITSRFSVQWRGLYFVVCSFQKGKLNQCTVSLEDLESPYYTHCWLLSRLCRKHFKFSHVLSTAPSPRSSLETTNVFNVIANKDPTWLCYPNALLSAIISPAFITAFSVNFSRRRKIMLATWPGDSL